MPSVPNPVIEKIRKLQALAERAGTEAEAANAAARVRELLEKHNLDIGTVQLEAEPGTEKYTAIGTRKPHFNILSRACCQLFDVECFWEGSGQKWRLAFVGLEANVETALLTFQWLVQSVESLLDGWKRSKPLMEGFLFACKPVKREDYYAFRAGAATKIHDMAIKQKRAAGVNLELVHVGNAIAKRMMDALQFSDDFMPRAPKKSSDHAFREGYRQGSRVDLQGARENRMVRGKE